MRLKTWYFEYTFVASVLCLVVVLTGNKPVEWIGALAVMFTFGHASVANRLEEREALRMKQLGKAEVECYRWISRYFLLKEISWFAYFVLLGAYSALVGVVIFLLYPWWRKWWRTRHPLK